MPVTAKLSKRFYDTFGEDVAAELVDWFNQVDATYSANLRELNDLNFQRFDAKLGERLAELEAKMSLRFADLETKFERRMAESDARWERRFGESDVKWEQRIAAGEARLEARLEKKWERQLAAVRDDLKTTLASQEQLAAFRTEMADRLGDLRGELVRWMFLGWTGIVVAVITATVLG